MLGFFVKMNINYYLFKVISSITNKGVQMRFIEYNNCYLFFYNSSKN